MNTCTRPHLEAKYRSSIIMTVLHNMMRYEVCTFFFKIAICLRDSDTLISVYKLHCES